jgi:hypothetical protein
MTRSLYWLTIATIWLFAANMSAAGDLLFVKASRNYDAKGLLGTVYRQELETRMLTHATWRERLYINTYYPSKDETLEVYSRSDGSRWLSFKRATPSLGQSILSRIWVGHKFDLKKELDASTITAGEIELPADVAEQVERLWQTMLPGPSKEPEARGLYMDAPTFIGFAKRNDSVNTGTIAFAAYHTPAYDEFVDIANDLIRICEHPGFKLSALQKLRSKIRNLTARLNAKH